MPNDEIKVDSTSDFEFKDSKSDFLPEKHDNRSPRSMDPLSSHAMNSRHRVKILRETERYLQIDASSHHPVLKNIRKSGHFIKWAFKLLIPDFLIGHPNLFDNLKTLFVNPRFRPLRTAFVAWVIFAVTMGSTGIYALLQSDSAKASGDFSIQTGYYYGSGVTRSISGLGFTPEVVIIKSDTAAGQLVWKSSAMPAAVSSYLGVATANNTENEITLDADGFTVSQALEVNTINVTYTFIAFRGSDCTATGVMCVGSYVGNGVTGVTSQAITTGFQPDLVWVKRTTALVGAFRTSSMTDNEAGFFSAALNNSTGIYFTTLDATGFTVGSSHNTNGGVFYYVAFKSLAGKLAVGSFTGNGVDNRNISGLGFEPDFVLVKQNSAVVPAFNTTEMYGDYSSVTTAAASAVNHIQSLDSDGFQVGNSTSVNANAVPSYWFAFGGSTDPTPSGTFLLHKGSYTGNGTSQTIETGFAPNLVIIKGNTAQSAVWSTSLEGDATEYFSTAAAAFTTGITGMSDTGFSVGAHATVNTNGVTYEYLAFGNATSPRTGDGAANFYIGTYSGNGIDGRVIDHLGFAPSMVVVKRSVGTANQSFWTASSSTMTAGTTAYFAATADITNSTVFASLTSDGFTMGTNAAINAAAGTYTWFAFAEGAYFDIGSFVGNSVDDREITGVGFQPDYVWIKRDSAINAVHRSSSATIDASSSLHFAAAANDTNDIKGFTADGFILGTSAEVNTTSGNYRYAAWHSNESTSPPDTPVNQSPASSATSQDLNTTLTGSTYNDTDSDPHLATKWQVDDDSDFATPVWTRTSVAPEVSTTVNTTNGTFANELSGKSELDHATTYYWRLRYSDGVYSARSTATSFTTNIISTPSNSSPANLGSVTSLTPTLSASAFSDAQTGHTASSSQWQISSTSDFTTPIYDSGEVSYASTFAVPGAVLADRNSYYWRVRYSDSSGLWSAYSTATKFVTAESRLSVKPLFGSTVVDQGDAVKIDAQIKLTDGSLVNDASATINIYDPDGVKIVNAGTMSYISGSSGNYRYSYTVPSTSGSYLYEVTAVSGSVTGYGAANFEVRTISANVSSALSAVQSEQSAQTSERAAQALSRSTVDAISASTTNIASGVASLQSNLDILIGAFIVTQSSVSDVSASTTAFTTALTNTTDDFYKNAVLTFTSGDLSGQNRRISAYDGSTKQVSLDPALTAAPSNGDTFTIVTQNVRVEEQVASHEASQSAFRSDTTSRLTSIEGKIDTLTATLNTVDSNLSAIQSTLNSVRSSQQSEYKVSLSDVSEIQAGNTYRAKLTVLDFESNPINPTTTPKIAIYNALRSVEQASTTMTRIATGVYEYTASVASDATNGLWESVVYADVGGTSEIVANDYWQVTGAPAQVLINSISDTSVPSIQADVTITNEGGGPYEYQYEWCVVTTQDNQCGGDDDSYYASAAKLINAGDSFNPTLSATVSSVGDYWFKLVVYYGTEASGASRTFTATTGDSGSSSSSSSSGTVGGGGGYSSATNENIYSELIKARKQLDLNSAKLSNALDLLGVLTPGLQGLLSVGIAQTQGLNDVQNKVADLKAVSAVTRRLLEQSTNEPIVETFMKFNSVEIHFLISNPDDVKQTVKFKSYLPSEVKPENIIDLSGLKLDYDANASAYAVSGDIVLGPKESITKKVEIKDIWIYQPDDLKSLARQALDYSVALNGTQYEAQGVLLKNEIETMTSAIATRQEQSYSSPQDHIIAFRENKDKLARADSALAKLKDLVVQVGASRGLVGQVGGIQTFATWGIILAIIFGFGLLAAVIFAMWRHQTLLAAMAMGMKEEQAIEKFGSAVERRKKVSKKTLPLEIVGPKVDVSAPTPFVWRTVLMKSALFIVTLIISILIVQTLPDLFSQKYSNNTSEAPNLPVTKTAGVAEGPLMQPVQPEASPEAALRRILITKTPTGWLNIRAEASLDGIVVGKVYPGEEYEYVNQDGNWYKILLPSGSTGWVIDSYVKKVL